MIHHGIIHLYFGNVPGHEQRIERKNGYGALLLQAVENIAVPWFDLVFVFYNLFCGFFCFARLSNPG